MPGPMYGAVLPLYTTDENERTVYVGPHSKCPEKERCTGARCKADTGKTRRRRQSNRKPFRKGEGDSATRTEV